MILGGGVSGLAAAMSTGLPVYEAQSAPGGLCCSYVLQGYRFEVGGGHWIFGGKPHVLDWLQAVAPCRRYTRNSAVWLPTLGRLVDYPLQHHVDQLPPDWQRKIHAEQARPTTEAPDNGKNWLQARFGETLCQLFFWPFQELYTAGLYARLQPQDGYKSPTAGSLSQGYNSSFLYPEAGLQALTQAMAERCQVHLQHRAVGIDWRRRQVHFANGKSVDYQQLISTLPLRVNLELCELDPGARADPHTSVVVLNLGGRPGPACPDRHWIYFPSSRSGFHRVGIYSAVDPDFAPPGRVSFYVERSYQPDAQPGPRQMGEYQQAVIQELQEMGWLGEVEVADSNWVEYAYTWAWSNSDWRAESLSRLQECGIISLGRYARWVFQGIADSIGDGLDCQ